MLAALLATIPARAGKGTVAYRVSIPEQPLGPVRIVPCKGDAYGPNMKCAERPDPYEWALEVTYKDRTVRLTGDQVMDALEGMG